MKYFISDLHLNADRPEITALFLRFLSDMSEASELYILGDFFDTYIGDKQAEPYATVCKALNTYSQVRPVYFMPGNRDFLVDETFARDSGCTLIPDPYIIDHGDQKILLMHGDSLCTEDKAYQRYRRIVHNRYLQWFFLHLPLTLRRAIAKKMQQKSKEMNHRKPTFIMDVSSKTVEALLKQTKAHLLIHGHTHRPNIHQHSIDNTMIPRMVLPDWGHTGGYGILSNSGQYTLHDFK